MFLREKLDEVDEILEDLLADAQKIVEILKSMPEWPAKEKYYKLAGEYEEAIKSIEKLREEIVEQVHQEQADSMQDFLDTPLE